MIFLGTYSTKIIACRRYSYTTSKQFNRNGSKKIYKISRTNETV